jgi:threonylcarbamoyladenosine tRNA methylthiotransferase CDKAL1
VTKRALDGPLSDVSVIGISQIDRVVEVVEETLRGHTVKLLEKKALPSLDLPKVRRDNLIEIVPLSTGCLGSCTYCKTKHARGVLGSYAPEAIVARVQKALAEGVKEIWLSSEDTGAYGRDIGTTLPHLLARLVALLDDRKDVMLRVGMTNPPFILDHLDEIAEILRHPQVFSFLHVPVQSGSDSVLMRMNREYTVAEFERVVSFLKRKVPDMVIATDIICGFPGESDEEWEKTMSLVKKYNFPILNISQFYPRPGTPAARMRRVRTQTVKARSRELTRLFESQKPYAETMSQRRNLRVLIGNEVNEKFQQSVGHTKGYVKVLIPRDDDLRGKMVRVNVRETAKWHIVADVIAVEDNRGVLQPYLGPANLRDTPNGGTNPTTSEDVPRGAPKKDICDPESCSEDIGLHEAPKACAKEDCDGVSSCGCLVENTSRVSSTVSQSAMDLVMPFLIIVVLAIVASAVFSASSSVGMTLSKV